MHINIGQILNKIYLGYYHNQTHFWAELGLAIRNYLKIYPNDESDYRRIGITIMECAIFLYEQWHTLCRQRYLALKKELVEKQVIPERMVEEE